MNRLKSIVVSLIISAILISSVGFFMTKEYNSDDTTTNITHTIIPLQDPIPGKG